MLLYIVVRLQLQLSLIGCGAIDMWPKGSRLCLVGTRGPTLELLAFLPETTAAGEAAVVRLSSMQPHLAPAGIPGGAAASLLHGDVPESVLLLGCTEGDGARSANAVVRLPYSTIRIRQLYGKDKAC